MKIVIVIVLLVPFIHWLINLKQGLDCDFEAPYKCEVVSVIGVVIPPAALITVYVNKGK